MSFNKTCTHCGNAFIFLPCRRKSELFKVVYHSLVINWLLRHCLGNAAKLDATCPILWCNFAKAEYFQDLFSAFQQNYGLC
mgnify:CR=1 FL=1